VYKVVRQLRGPSGPSAVAHVVLLVYHPVSLRVSGCWCCVHLFLLDAVFCHLVEPLRSKRPRMPARKLCQRAGRGSGRADCVSVCAPATHAQSLPPRAAPVISGRKCRRQQELWAHSDFTVDLTYLEELSADIDGGDALPGLAAAAAALSAELAAAAATAPTADADDLSNGHQETVTGTAPGFAAIA
jgi:hypothetical protein